MGLLPIRATGISLKNMKWFQNHDCIPHFAFIECLPMSSIAQKTSPLKSILNSLRRKKNNAQNLANIDFTVPSAHVHACGCLYWYQTSHIIIYLYDFTQSILGYYICTTFILPLGWK